ncbi:hypothetical protein ACUN24_00875 [Pedobacter sp. WC2501]|uniref:hypothetical protein n=1 Tax=Pedobacter sp. WC2501 TaxID=3461400 RepID=UPI004045AA99
MKIYYRLKVLSIISLIGTGCTTNRDKPPQVVLIHDTVRVHDTIYIKLKPATEKQVVNSNKKSKAQIYLETSRYFQEKEKQSDVGRNPNLYKTVITPSKFSEENTNKEFGYNPNRKN